MERLDEISKLLAESVSRRESLRSIGAVIAGTVFSSLGVGTAWAARPDRCLRIPTRPEVRSLNLSNSAAVAMYEAVRQWEG